MNKTNRAYRITTFMVVIIIILLGTFRDRLIFHLNQYLGGIFNEESNYWLSEFIDAYGSSKSISLWMSHYLLFYPLYLGCHFLLVSLLFKNYPVARKWLNWGLILILLVLISGKIIFGILEISILEEYFSFAFHKLIALPFLLLFIEGGRSIYKMIDEY